MSNLLLKLSQIFDSENLGYLTASQVKNLYASIRVGGISLSQVIASMDVVCGNADCISHEELLDLIKEMDRRYFLVQDLKWEFALLDNNRKGFISIDKAKFLFEAVHGKLFFIKNWNQFVQSRTVKSAPVTFSEIEVELCNASSIDDVNVDLNEKSILKTLVKKNVIVDTVEIKKKNVNSRRNENYLEQNKKISMIQPEKKLNYDGTAKCFTPNIPELEVINAAPTFFENSESKDKTEDIEAKLLLQRMKRINRLRNEVLELKQSTISELRSYQNPMTAIHNVMKATYLLLQTSEKETNDWKNIQALLGKTGREGLKRRIKLCDVDNIQLATASRAKELIGDIDLEVIRDISAGAATFFVWVDGMIKEVENNCKDSS